MQLTIRMPDEYLPKIERIAMIMGLRKSDVTRIAIKKFIEEYSDDKEIQPYSVVKNLLGSVESGTPDLGQNHRKYLLEKIRDFKK